MGLVLWIDKNTFATNLLEKVFKQKNLPFYSIPSVSDFSYLVDDLNPVAIVIDPETFRDDPEAFKRQFEASAKLQTTPWIALGSWEGLDGRMKLAGVLPRKFDPFSIPQKLQEILTGEAV